MSEEKVSYYEQNKERLKKKANERYRKNREKVLAYQREYDKRPEVRQRKAEGAIGCCKDCFNCKLPDCFVDSVTIPGGDWTNLTMIPGYEPTSIREQVQKLNRDHDPREIRVSAYGDPIGTWGDLYEKQKERHRREYAPRKRRGNGGKQEISTVG